MFTTNAVYIEKKSIINIRFASGGYWQNIRYYHITGSVLPI